MAACSGRCLAADDGGDFLSFSFDRVDIRAFAQIVGEFTGRRIVVADDVSGDVSIVSPRVSRAEAWSLFGSVVESSGFATVQDEGFFRLVRVAEKTAPGMGAIVPDGGEIPAHGLVTAVFAVDNVPAAEMRDLLEGLVGRKAAMSVLPDTNHLVVSDTADTVRRARELVERLDRPGMARATEIIPLSHADASQLSRQISAAFAESQSRAQQLLQRIPSSSAAAGAPPAMRPPTVVPVEHSNSIMVSGSRAQIQAVSELVAKMDVPASPGRSGLRMIQLDYLKAGDVAKNITTLLEKFAAGNPDTSLSRRIAVEAVEKANALIVNAQPADFDELAALVRSLDVEPKQVHISVLIAEVSEGDADTLGVQLTGLRTPDRVGGIGVGASTRFSDEASTGSGLLGSIASSLYPEGLTFGIAHGSHLDANGNVVSDYPAVFSVDAIKQNSKVKILANPTLGAQNNSEAEVSIVNNIPLTESTITGAGDARDVIQNITRQDVGVKLSLTPHIVPGGMVQIELAPSIEAVIDTGGDAGGSYAPTISKRSVKTTMTVPDGETIVIAGLSRADKTEVKRKIPLLGDIPLLGWLFRWSSEQEERTNILIFVTPHVMEDVAAAAKVRESLEGASGISAAGAAAELKADGLQ
ncbi:MAG: type II secretion system secretin GspD [Kiritimatiellae bacterium]|nr:type II secretion system secretin GspD [Kiritimatiellia bacterium]